jgi:hypothetical protein
VHLRRIQRDYPHSKSLDVQATGPRGYCSRKTIYRRRARRMQPLCRNRIPPKSSCGTRFNTRVSAAPRLQPLA